MLTNSKIALSVALVLATASAALMWLKSPSRSPPPKLNTTQIAHDLLGPPSGFITRT
jgi:hypothetical protein